MKLQDSEPKPKRPRKKTKPSALTRPPKKGKKKKNQRKITRPQKPLPPELPTGDTGMAFNSILHSEWPKLYIILAFLSAVG